LLLVVLSASVYVAIFMWSPQVTDCHKSLPMKMLGSLDQNCFISQTAAAAAAAAAAATTTTTITTTTTTTSDSCKALKAITSEANQQQ